MRSAVSNKKAVYKKHVKAKAHSIKQLVPAPRCYQDLAQNVFDSTKDKNLFQSKCFSYIRAGNVATLSKLISVFKERYNDFTLDFKEELSGNTPVMVATYHNKLKTLKLLLENGADATLQNNNHETVLAFGTKATQTAIFGGKPKGLLHAAWKGDLDQVKTLLQNAENKKIVNLCNADGLSPLLLATRDINKFETGCPLKKYQPLAVVKELLKHNANPLKSDSKGRTALHYIAYNSGNRAGGIASVLLPEMRDVDVKDSEDTSPLHLACSSASLSVAEVLIRGGANINAQDIKGRTPLHLTCVSGCEVIASLLMLNNASTELADKTGSLAIDLVESENMRALISGVTSVKSDSTKPPSRESSLPTITNRKVRSKSDPVKYKGGIKAKNRRKVSSFADKSEGKKDKSDRDAIDARLRQLQDAMLRKSPKVQRQALSDTESPRSSSRHSATPDSENGRRLPTRPSKLEPLGSDSPIPTLTPRVPIEHEEVDHKGDDNLDADIISRSAVKRSFNKKQVLPHISHSRQNSPDLDRARDGCASNTNSCGTDCFSEEQYHNQQRYFMKERASTFADIKLSRSKQEKMEYTTRASGVAYEFRFDDLDPSSEEDNRASPAQPKLPMFIPLEKRNNSHVRKFKGRRKKEPLPLPLKGLEEEKKKTFTKESENLISRVRESLAVFDGSNLSEVMAQRFKQGKKALRRVISDTALLEAGRMADAEFSKDNTVQLVRLNQMHNSFESNEKALMEPPPRRLSRSLSPSLTNNEEDGIETQTRVIQRQAFSAKAKSHICDNTNCGLILLNSNKVLRSEDICQCPKDLNKPPDRHSPGIERMNRKLSPKLRVRRVELMNRRRYLLESDDESVQPRKAENLNFMKKLSYGKKLNTSGDYRLITSSVDISDDEFWSSGDEIMGVGHLSDRGDKKRTDEIVFAARASTNIVPRKPLRTAETETRERTREHASPVVGRNTTDSNSDGSDDARIASKRAPTLKTASSTFFQSNKERMPTRQLPEDKHSPEGVDGESQRDKDDKVRKPESLLLESVNVDNLYTISQSHNEKRSPERDIVEQTDTAKSTKDPIPSSKRLSINTIDEETVEKALDSQSSEPPTEGGVNCGSKNGEFSELAELMFSPNVVDSDLQVAGFPRQTSASESTSSSITNNTDYQRFNSLAAVPSIDSDDEDDDLIGFQLGNLLGKGAYGHVYLGLTPRGTMIAVKQVPVGPKCDRKATKQYASLRSEVNVLKGLDHKNIVRFLGTRFNEGTVSILMEYLPGGSIASVLARFGPLAESVVKRYTRQILCGVAYLHENGIVHRDIKGGNVMVMANGIVKLIDFGCARRLNLSLTNTTLLKSVKGTPFWMAPEVIRGTGHDFKSDVWSVGCTVYEMANGKPPWSHLSMYAAMFAIANETSDLPEMPEGLSTGGKEFILRCLIRDPNSRPPVTEIQEHHFLQRRISGSTMDQSGSTGDQSIASTS